MGITRSFFLTDLNPHFLETLGRHDVSSFSIASIDRPYTLAKTLRHPPPRRLALKDLLHRAPHPWALAPMDSFVQGFIHKKEDGIAVLFAAERNRFVTGA